MAKKISIKSHKNVNTNIMHENISASCTCSTVLNPDHNKWKLIWIYGLQTLTGGAVTVVLL